MRAGRRAPFGGKGRRPLGGRGRHDVGRSNRIRNRGAGSPSRGRSPVGYVSGVTPDTSTATRVRRVDGLCSAGPSHSLAAVTVPRQVVNPMMRQLFGFQGGCGATRWCGNSPTDCAGTTTDSAARVDRSPGSTASTYTACTRSMRRVISYWRRSARTVPAVDRGQRTRYSVTFGRHIWRPLARCWIRRNRAQPAERFRSSWPNSRAEAPSSPAARAVSAPLS